MHGDTPFRVVIRNHQWRACPTAPDAVSSSLASNMCFIMIGGSGTRMKVTGPPRFGNGARVVVAIGLGLSLGLWIAATQGISVAAEYYAAYFLEEMLSVDNIFVFLIIFSSSTSLNDIPAPRASVRRRGCAGVPRADMIGAGIALIRRFSWITYPFAALIFFAAWRLLFGCNVNSASSARPATSARRGSRASCLSVPC